MSTHKSPIVLLRPDLAEQDEYKICFRHFDTSFLRTECKNRLVIGRYSCLPYYLELVHDLANINSVLINSFEQHKWISNFEWYHALKGYTPKTWFEYEFHNCTYQGPFIVKGCTNSRKLYWNKMMFAENKEQATHIRCELLSDSYICTQGIVFRKYIPLETYEIGLNGLPFTNEWRFFFYKGTLLSYGYYWSIAEKTDYQCPSQAIEFACSVAKIAKNYANFFVLDVAKTQDGRWILIEVNDGQQSGLSENNPDTLYHNLAMAIRNES
jgi:hypothetical protein